MKTKYHPILFSTPMVQAIDENRKTKTRRTKGLEKINDNPDLWSYEGIAVTINFPTEKNDMKVAHYFKNIVTGFKSFVKCPYEVDDVLWVRETYREIEQEVGAPRFEYKATEKINLKDKWKPSLFMPKIACRKFLKIKSIRAERLHDISEHDAIAEGVELYDTNLYRDYLDERNNFSNARNSFYSLWISINGNDYSNKNPFVWVYEFEKIEKPEDFLV